ncbi:MAG: peptidylprolyl isomerase [Candidatus Delongbacteria bacterium]|jgi:cyclophilin family peptidyl-prolyl cis-trans isomerase|nr:peptidylprolyl isomerase [Candidatus Delongbacteria bacterium]
MKIRLFLLILLLCRLIYGSSLDSTAFYVDSAVLETEKGNIMITFFEKEAPNHVINFKKLIESGFYNGKIFHRVIEDFVIQTGKTEKKDLELIDPEINKIHFRGAVGAGRKDDKVNPDMKSDPTEFYITLRPKPELDGKYTIFGRVAEGMDVVEEISKMHTNDKDFPDEPVKIIKVYLKKYFDKERYEYMKMTIH